MGCKVKINMEKGNRIKSNSKKFFHFNLLSKFHFTGLFVGTSATAPKDLHKMLLIYWTGLF